MYIVKCDSYVLSDLRDPDLILYNPKLNLEVNKNGSMEFDIYPNHPNFSKLRKLKSVISVIQDNKIIFKGRIISDAKGFYNEKHIDIEGILAYLNDSIVEPFEFSGSVETFFTKLISNHNRQVSEFQRFKVGKVTVKDLNDYIHRSCDDYLNSREILQTRLIDELGGYINVRYELDGNYIDYLDNFENTSTQEIECSKNLLDLVQKSDASNIKTVIFPLGAKLKDENGNETNERLTISSVHFEKTISSEKMADYYGHITQVVKFDDITSPENLLKKAKEYLKNSLLIENSIEVSAIDLNNIDKDIETFKFCDFVRIKSSIHNIDATYLLSKMCIDLYNPQNNEITLGKVFKSLSDINQSIINYKK